MKWSNIMKSTQQIIDNVLALREKGEGASIISTVQHIGGKHEQHISAVGDLVELTDLLDHLCVSILKESPTGLIGAFLIDLSNRLLEEKDDNN